MKAEPTLVAWEAPLKGRWTYILLLSLPREKIRVKDFLPNALHDTVPVGRGFEPEKVESIRNLHSPGCKNWFLDFSQRYFAGLLLLNSCLHGARWVLGFLFYHLADVIPVEVLQFDKFGHIYTCKTITTIKI